MKIGAPKKGEVLANSSLVWIRTQSSTESGRELNGANAVVESSLGKEVPFVGLGVFQNQLVAVEPRFGVSNGCLLGAGNTRGVRNLLLEEIRDSIITYKMSSRSSWFELPCNNDIGTA